jgi:hypothetical protein
MVSFGFRALFLIPLNRSLGKPQNQGERFGKEKEVTACVYKKSNHESSDVHHVA